MFKIYGLLFALLLGVCAVVIANPPPGYAPEGYAPPAPAPGVAAEGIEWPAMLRRGRFWVMFVAYFCATFPGLLMMAVAKPAAVSLGGLSAAAAVTAVSFIGLANSGGRVLWGTLSDVVGRAKTLVAVTLVLVCAMTLLALGGGGWTLWVGYVFSAMCFGGALGLFPSLTTEAFGVKRATTNYAFMFCAFGLASLVAPWAGGRFHAPDGEIRFAAAFSFASGVAAVGFLLAAGLRRSGRKGAENAA